MKKLLTILVVVSLVVFAGCEKTFFEPEPKNDPEAVFDEMWHTFKTDYGPFEERGVDWDAQYQIFRPQVNASTTEAELIVVLKSLLRTLNDGHVSLTTPNSPIFYSNEIVDQRIDDALFDLDLIKSNYLQNAFTESGANVYGSIGNIGYWYIRSIGLNMFETDGILDQFAWVDGLIVDMRHNRGGNFTYAFSEFGRFTNEERLVFKSRTKNGTGPNDFTDWFDWRIQPSGTYFDKPIVLLTDRYTISAGERAVMAFKTLPNVTHLGDTTNGAISTKIAKELANGWFYSIATQKSLFHDGSSFEGAGIPPDEYVKNTAVEMTNGQDRTLELAISKF